MNFQHKLKRERENWDRAYKERLRKEVAISSQADQLQAQQPGLSRSEALRCAERIVAQVGPPGHHGSGGERMKTSELKDRALDWAVAVADGRWQKWITSEKRLGTSVMDVGLYGHSGLRAWSESKDWFEPYSPSTDPAQAWPIIERERIEWQWLPASNKAHQYGARKPSMGGINRTFCHDGPTILVAVMRCFVASRLGDEVDVPKELA